MTIGECLFTGTKRLEQKKIETARLDTLLIMESAAQKDRAWLLANQNLEISNIVVQKVNNLLNQRETLLPIAYLLGHVEFYGRQFVVNKHVLVPRPETEDMIDLLLELFKNEPELMENQENIPVADLGSGSGAIGITAKLIMPKLAVDLIDISEDALKVSKINVDKYTLNINTIESNLLSRSITDYRLLLCNLPYVPDSMSLNSSASHEPRLAIFGGRDGLDIYKQLAEQIKLKKNKPLYILIEAFPLQHQELINIFKNAGYKRLQTRNFIAVFSLAKI